MAGLACRKLNPPNSGAFEESKNSGWGKQHLFVVQGVNYSRADWRRFMASRTALPGGTQKVEMFSILLYSSEASMESEFSNADPGPSICSIRGCSVFTPSAPTGSALKSR
jgi:hypothetical protein